jgi:hypothetical protein
MTGEKQSGDREIETSGDRVNKEAILPGGSSIDSINSLFFRSPDHRITRSD